MSSAEHILDRAHAEQARAELGPRGCIDRGQQAWLERPSGAADSAIRADTRS